MKVCPACGFVDKPDMHIIEVTAQGVSCNCGYSYKSLTGSEAQWVGQRHAQANRPSLVRDLRFTKEG